MRSGTNRTKYITAKIKAPGSSKYVLYSYSKAKAYKFTKSGTYYVTYYVKNKNKPYRQASKSIMITSYGNAVIKTGDITVPQGTTDTDMISAVRANVTITDNGQTINGTSSKVSVVLSKNADGSAVATVSYKGKNATVVTKKVNVNLEVVAV